MALKLSQLSVLQRSQSGGTLLTDMGSVANIRALFGNKMKEKTLIHIRPTEDSTNQSRSKQRIAVTSLPSPFSDQPISDPKEAAISNCKKIELAFLSAAAAALTQIKNLVGAFFDV